jgi:hypothetical protein
MDGKTLIVSVAAAATPASKQKQATSTSKRREFFIENTSCILSDKTILFSLERKAKSFYA